MTTHAPPAPRPLPPGPSFPRWLQTLGFMVGGVRYLEWCRRRYGDIVTMGTVFDERFVMLFDPAAVKEVFQGSNDQLHAGEANALLGPIVGERSVLLLDGAEHLRHRRLMLPAFHGQRMLAHVETMRDCADTEIDRWPVAEPFTLLESMQALTLRVILRAVFGYAPGADEDELARRLRAMVEPLSRARGALLLNAVMRGRSERRSAAEFAARRRAVDEIIYAEIARRRAAPDLAERDDVFSALLLARDEEGVALTDREVRDELLTLLLAGHETTATGLAWTFDLVLHDARVHARACEGDDGYLDAVIKESLRIRPVIPGVGRVVRQRPFALGAYEVPVGVEINPSIRSIHRRGDLYPSPRAFLPERFLADAAGGRGPDQRGPAQQGPAQQGPAQQGPAQRVPDTYTWVPFGGGTRRCLGASFALTEMRVVLARVLERTALSPVDPEPAKGQFRAITIAPKGGVRVRQDRAPLPATSPPATAAVASASDQRVPAA